MNYGVWEGRGVGSKGGGWTGGNVYAHFNMSSKNEYKYSTNSQKEKGVA